ncbi:MAG: Crp/Fnr family transcriptional regulator [Spirochaetia bacterium]|jgi:CRP/FNR family transcriptional regulator|nr:Crp/Fnr family transcriptional regulator [Spirochaetia bacterium]
MNQELDTMLPFYKVLRTSDQLALDSLPIKMYEEGNLLPRCSGVLCVFSGRLRVYIINENGKEMTLYRLFDNDICVLSGSCGLKNISFEVLVKAEAPTKLLTIPTVLYHRLENQYPEVTAFTGSMMAARLSDVMWTLEQVAFSSMDRRVASYLIEQRAILQSDELPITHDAIAKDIGTAREVISRMLKYFQNEGWITQGRGKIVLVNPSALLALSEH